jgi:prepilin-type N-terminal cleavage/methylation domain-containing protein
MGMKKAFSLIELLIVVALIGILTAIASASYSTMQKKARDNRRVSDMKALQNAFEQYYGDNNAYSNDCLLAITYLPSGLPVDPKNSTPYEYSGFSSCTVDGYCFCALLETGNGNATDLLCSFDSGNSGNYYCIKQLQK